mmetsp:Transcript_12104/g.32103  ORF Transcript_12104/g.32103 Transcript_12104/m.32103 type:complete len:200 (+) Transcript_12104:290-889(+)
MVWMLSDAKQVVEHENLPTCVNASPNSNCGYGKALCDGSCDRRRHALEHHREAPRILQTLRAVEHGYRLLRRSTGGSKTANGTNGLRRESYVSHDGDSRVGDGADGGEPSVGRPLNLHGVHISLLEHAHGGSHGVAGRRFEASERQVSNDERAFRPSHDRSAVHDHLVECDGQCRIVSVHDHRDGVSDKHHVNVRRRVA